MKKLTLNHQKQLNLTVINKYNMEFLKFIFSNGWIFFGFIIILGGVFSFIYAMWNRFLRHLSLMKHGYPEGTNGDGEFQEKEVKE